MIAVCFALAICAAAQPAASDIAKADVILQAARSALGAKLSSLQSLSFWGSDRHGAESSTMSLSFDVSGKYLRELSAFTTGGEVERVGTAGNDASLSGGGMPGDDGGPAMLLKLTEGFDGDDYWYRHGAGSGKHSFVNACVRLMLALTLSPPAGFPVSFQYGGRLESPHGTIDALEGKGPGGFLIHLYMDADAHVPVTMVYNEGPQEIQLWLKDYRTEDGIRFPHTFTWLADGSPVEEFQIQHLKVNPKLRPAKFRR